MMEKGQIRRIFVVLAVLLSLIFSQTVMGQGLDEAKRLNQKVIELYGQGRYEEAINYAKRALEIREKSLGREHPDVATGINDLAVLYESTGRYAEAEPLYKRSLEIREKALGREHPDVAQSLNNLAGLYRNTGRYSEAEPLYKRSLEIREKALGREHPDVAQSLNDLAVLYSDTGRYSEAEPLFKRSLEIKEKALGREHPDVATSLNNLAALYTNTGRNSEAEPLYKRSLEIWEKALGKEHPDVATSLNNLAELYRNTGRHAEAEPLYKRSLEIWEKALGREHPDVAQSLNNLADLYRNTGRYSEAEPLYKRSLEIKEKALGREHPDVAQSLNDLAVLYSDTGRYAEAEPLHKRSLEILEKALGREHPDVAVSLNNLSLLYASTDKHLESHNYFKRGISIEDFMRENVFLLLNEKQKISYMNQNESSIHAFMSHTVKYMQSNPQSIADTFNSWLKWKGAVLEAQGRYMDAAMQSKDPAIRKRFDDLINIRREIAKMQLSKPEKGNFEDYRNRINELEKKKEGIEAELSRMSKEFTLEKTIGRADVKRISEILPKDSAYIDFARINSYDFKEGKWDKPKYIAFVLIPIPDRNLRGQEKEPETRLIEIGEAEDIEKHVMTYLQEMNKIKTSGKAPDKEILNREAQDIYNIVMKPLEPYVKGRRHLFISPDGNLNLIPFEALVMADGKYLIEGYSISYISAGRDIIRFTDTTIAKGDALIIADPDYDMGLMERDKIAKELKVAKTIRGGVSRDASLLYFPRLPETKQEADDIEKVLKQKKGLKVRNYQGRSAIEEVIFSSETPRILHIATHGYFLKDEELKGSGDIRGIAIKLKEDFTGVEEINPVLSKAGEIENPMLRSGIVFSGVNASLKAGRDEGMVSAEKILGLNLKGTDLVVLSACDTGVGDVKNGEGVFGLKRAFILSGAKTLVMSLWSVPSAETTELMTEFYTLMSEGKSKSDALRQAKLDMMKKKQNPFYWGAFVMTGKP